MLVFFFNNNPSLDFYTLYFNKASCIFLQMMQCKTVIMLLLNNNDILCHIVYLLKI